MTVGLAHALEGYPEPAVGLRPVDHLVNIDAKTVRTRGTYELRVKIDAKFLNLSTLPASFMREYVK